MIRVGSKVAYTADMNVDEPGCPMGIVVAGQVEVTMPDYMRPGPPPRDFKPGDDDHTDLAWLVAWYGEAGDEPVSPVWADDMYLIEIPHYTQYKPLEPRSHTMRKFYVQALSSDGEKLDDSYLIDNVGLLIDATLERLSEAIKEVRVYGDEEEAREEGVKAVIREWTSVGWTGAVELVFPDGLRWEIKQAALGPSPITVTATTTEGETTASCKTHEDGRHEMVDEKPAVTLLMGALDAIRAENASDAVKHIKTYLRQAGLIETPDSWVEPMGQPTGRVSDVDADVDAITAQAYSDIQRVIDDLRSWESNVESAGYNADKLAEALAVIRRREADMTNPGYTKEGN